MADIEYSGDPTTSQTDELRFLIGDTADPHMISDPEFDYLLGKWMPAYGSVTFVASIAAYTLARKFAGAPAISADGVSVDLGQLADKYRALAQDLMDQYNQETDVNGAPDITNLLYDTTFDPSIKPLIFGIHLMDQQGVDQDFGGSGGMPSYGYDDGLEGLLR